MDKAKQINCPACGCPGGPHGIVNTDPPTASRAILVLTMEDGYLSLNALSEYAGLSVKQLRGYINDPTSPLPAFQTDGGETGRGKLLVKRSEYDQWAERHLRRRSPQADIDAAVAEALEGL